MKFLPCDARRGISTQASKVGGHSRDLSTKQLGGSSIGRPLTEQAVHGSPHLTKCPLLEAH